MAHQLGPAIGHRVDEPDQVAGGDALRIGRAAVLLPVEGPAERHSSVQPPQRNARLPGSRDGDLSDDTLEVDVLM